MNNFSGKILNLTQHQGTQDQQRAGLIDLEGEELQELKKFLTFNTPPTREKLFFAARRIVFLARKSGCKKAMIGGAPFFMSTLEEGLKRAGITPVYAFSRRESTEEIIDGAVIKRQVFKHVSFIEA